jgi:1-aminocyclopropane-1-carboxylate deaminase/D-cysteine desulfhydrase-like pyridoxal-dependent ACC family enzyme
LGERQYLGPGANVEMGHESGTNRLNELIERASGDVAVPPPLAGSDTPLEPLGQHGTCELFAKREDLLEPVGLGFKVRKVRWTYARAEADGVTDVILDGVTHSGCCAAAATLGRAFSLRVHVFLRGERPENPTGRLLQTLTSATSVEFVDPTRPADEAKLRKAEEIREHGGVPRVYPIGLSTPEALWGGIELAAQITDYEEEVGTPFDAVIVAVGTAGTAAGLDVGCFLLDRPWQVVGVCIDDEAPADYVPVIATLRRSMQALFPELPEVGALELVSLSDHRGYQVPSPIAAREADEVSRLYGLEFDPTYVAKAWAGGLEWLEEHPAIRRALFVVTGGQVT